MILVIAILFVILAIIVWIWVGRIDYMKKYHPDYKGDDFLDWGLDERDKNEIT